MFITTLPANSTLHTGPDGMLYKKDAMGHIYQMNPNGIGYTRIQ